LISFDDLEQLLVIAALPQRCFSVIAELLVWFLISIMLGYFL